MPSNELRSDIYVYPLDLPSNENLSWQTRERSLVPAWARTKLNEKLDRLKLRQITVELLTDLKSGSLVHHHAHAIKVLLSLIYSSTFLDFSLISVHTFFSSQLSYDLKQQPRGEYTCETKANATKGLRTSGKSRPDQGQCVYENAKIRNYQQSNLTNPRYNNYDPPDANVQYQRGS